MERVISNGVIYKITKYSDSSAIATCYTEDYGKIKLFVPKAFTKKGGIYSLIPGEIDFLKKDSVDLCKFYNFKPDTNYFEYSVTPEISLRLNLIFDFYDKLYINEHIDKVIWVIILKFKESDIKKINIFALYAIIKNTGNMFEFEYCAHCKKEISGNMYLLHGQCFCEACKNELQIEKLYLIEEFIGVILRSLGKKEMYKNLKINSSHEIKIIDLFTHHVESILGYSLKSSSLFKDIINTIY